MYMGILRRVVLDGVHREYYIQYRTRTIKIIVHDPILENVYVVHHGTADCSDCTYLCGSDADTPWFVGIIVRHDAGAVVLERRVGQGKSVWVQSMYARYHTAQHTPHCTVYSACSTS